MIEDDKTNENSEDTNGEQPILTNQQGHPISDKQSVRTVWQTANRNQPQHN